MWSAAYKEIRLTEIDETLQELQLATNRHIEVLGLENWKVEFRTERENKSGTITNTFNTLIYPSGQSNPIPFESYSGGESQRLQLAVTAALSEILLSRAGIDTNIEIYDESSKALSREGIVDLLECLKERAFTLQRSIYFVDHTMIESGHFDSIITIEKNPISGSRILT
jgi:exonuclease SbcC